MKRTPEFILGLIGSIWGIVISVFTLIVTGYLPVSSFTAGLVMTISFVGLCLGILAIVFACLVNTKTKTSGIVLIVCAVSIFLTNLLQIIPAILLLIAGIMCLARKLPAIHTEEKPEHT